MVAVLAVVIVTVAVGAIVGSFAVDIADDGGCHEGDASGGVAEKYLFATLLHWILP